MNDELNQVAQSFTNMVNSIAPDVDFWTLRLTDEKRRIDQCATGRHAAGL